METVGFARAMPDYAAFSIPDSGFKYGPVLSTFPYQENGGNVVAIAGDDFAVIASDTRLSIGNHIHTREQKKLFRLSDTTVLGSCGCWCDVLAFTTLVDTKMKMYEYEHRKTMSTSAVAHMISVSLYQKRFGLVYNISNILAGLDAEGKGSVYSFDAVGHTEHEQFTASGTAGAQIQPLLDNQIGRHNIDVMPQIPLTQERAATVIRDVFVSAAERDVFTGDGIIFYTITRKGLTMEEFPLRKD